MGLFRRGKVWWVNFTYKGKQVRKSTDTEDKKVAEKIYHKLMAEIAEGKWLDKLPGEVKTFRELMEKYLKEYSAINKAPTSHHRDKSLAGHLTKVFGGYTLSEIHPKMIAGYKLKRREEGASPRTICYELTIMSHAYNIAAKEWEWVKENPVEKISKGKVSNFIERWLTFEEEEKLLAASPEWLREIIVFAENTGLRQEELLSLRWPQIDLVRKTLTILEQKNNGKDTIPLNGRALEILKKRAKVRHIKTNYVFYSGNGTQRNAGNLRRAFYAALKKAEIEKCRFHDLRHTFATRLVQAGVDIYTVQKLGRWKNISMVMRYAHHYPESLRPAMDTLDKVYHNFITVKEKGAMANAVTP